MTGDDNGYKIIRALITIYVIFSMNCVYLTYDVNKDNLNSEYHIYSEVKIQSETRNTNDDIDWPMYKYDSHHTGYNPNILYNNSGRLRFKIRIHPTIETTSPSIDKYGNLYIGSSPSLTNSSTAVYSINKNKSINWIFHNNYGTVNDAVCVENDDNIYYTSSAGYIVSLYSDGTKNWFRKINSSSTSALTIYKKNLYFGANNGYLYKLNLNGTINLTVFLNNPVSSTISITDDSIYAITKNGSLFCMSHLGDIKWRYYSHDEIWGASPSISPMIDNDDNIYFGSWSK
ncbi:MAG: hypothetical protein U9R75_04560, partial [Candidatus Thermoplasmatota archaeon]|nr:hypothetical protein [Candidatus Thermoplasmatota archaeon]